MAEDKNRISKDDPLFKSTITVMIIYGAFILIFALIGFLSPIGRDLIFENGFAFSATFIIGTIVVIILLLIQVFSYSSDKETIFSGEEMVCPDYWELKKTPKEVLDKITDVQAKRLSTYYCENPSDKESINITLTNDNEASLRLKNIKQIYDVDTNYSMNCKRLYPDYLSYVDKEYFPSEPTTMRCEYLKKCPNNISWSSVCPNISNTTSTGGVYQGKQEPEVSTEAPSKVLPTRVVLTSTEPEAVSKEVASAPVVESGSVNPPVTSTAPATAVSPAPAAAVSAVTTLVATEPSAAPATGSVATIAAKSKPELKPEPKIELVKEIPGLMAWYAADSWNGRVWKDKSGNDYNASEVRGSIYTDKNKQYLYGGTEDGITFPPGILPNTYTLFHVAGHIPGSPFGRIFDGVDSNWLSGFHSTRSGSAYHGKWITNEKRPPVAYSSTDVLISTDQKNLYRANGITMTDPNEKNGTNTRLSINNGKYKTQSSKWRVFEVIVYDRELTTAEIEKVEDYLRVKYNEVLPYSDSFKSKLPEYIDKVKGYSGTAAENPYANTKPLKVDDPERCRQLALTSNGRYVAWGHRKDNHPNQIYKNTCFLYTKGFKPYKGNPNDEIHTTGCLKEGQRVDKGCQLA